MNDVYNILRAEAGQQPKHQNDPSQAQTALPACKEDNVVLVTRNNSNVQL